MSITSSSPLEVAKAASISSKDLAILPPEARNHALTAIHGALLSAKDTILAANAKDLEAATTAAADGQLSRSILKRLDLGRKGKWKDMLQGILDVRDLDDPEILHHSGRGNSSLLLAAFHLVMFNQTCLRTADP
ncbi:MAG: glutamate-5-semialdehyde dehydrogenase [Lasallia pustulata]|uniref:Glutamate-5-semialdehyde dehydrogenase n=1 Tax=Lasallia pustulata TaxID=136370 RepID=A0A5M8PWN8_9LECA|nr:MAG: glutamate-5-semialdehyde dehydrogenase [Lasallia pustulata]